MGKPKRKPTKRECDSNITLKLDADGGLVCIDGCGNQVEMGRCATLKFDADGKAARLAFKRSCKLDDDLKKRMQSVAENGVTVYSTDGE